MASRRKKSELPADGELPQLDAEFIPEAQPVDAAAELAPPAPVGPPPLPVVDHPAVTEVPAAAAAQEPKKQYQPDPFPMESISLSEGNDGPKMRLWRNNRKLEFAITFDEKPEPRHIETLKEAGFRWQGETKAWTKPMDRDAKWKTALDAERVFNDVGNAIRATKGLDVAGVGV